MSEEYESIPETWFVKPGFTMFSMRGNTVELTIQPAENNFIITGLDSEERELPEDYLAMKKEDADQILKSINQAIERAIAGDEFELEIDPWPKRPIE